MVYKRGDYGISVEKVDGFGKNPGLWIHKGNEAVKVASFGNSKKAEIFIRYLDYMFLIDGKEPNGENERDNTKSDC